MSTGASFAVAESPAGLDAWFSRVGGALRAGRLAPYLGPGLLALVPDAPVPTSYEALAEFIATKVALPRRARGNAWAAAQFVESQRHRATLTALMKQAFAAEVAPQPIHSWLAGLAPPLVVDSWYDSALRQALEGRTDWVEVQGITRAGIGEARWFRAYDSEGAEVSIAAARAARTLIYKPHGGARPAGNFLISDADYVEVLTEIDIQNPIPECVRERRAEIGFLFLGCHFDDQMLRTYARQIQKRSRGPNYAIFEHDRLTRMERRFALELGLDLVFCPMHEAVERLLAS